MNLFGLMETSGEAMAGRADARRGGGGQHGQRGDDTHGNGRSLSPSGRGVCRQSGRSGIRDSMTAAQGRQAPNYDLHGAAALGLPGS